MPTLVNTGKMSQDNPLTLPDGGDLLAGDADEDKILEAAAQTAMVNLLFLEQEIGRRILSPDLNNRTLIDMAEHSYKVSGMAKKQEPKDMAGRFVFTIDLGDDRTITIEQDMEPAQVEDDPMHLAREAVAVLEPANTLARGVFDDAPEFS